MKYLIKKNLLLLVIGILALNLFVFVNFVKADSVTDIDTGYLGGTGYNIDSASSTGQGFIPNHYNINSMDIHDYGITGNYQFWICKGSPDPTYFTNSYMCGDDEKIFDISLTGGSAWPTHIDIPLTTIQKNRYYYWGLKASSSFYVYPHTGYNYTNGQWYANTDLQPQTYLYDLPFRTYYDSTQDLSYIDITFPYATSTGWKDFNNFTVDYAYMNPYWGVGITDDLYISVYYKLANSNITEWYEDKNRVSYTEDIIERSIQKTNKLQNGSYQAYTSMYNISSTSIDFLGTSTLIEFDIDNENGYGDIFSEGVLMQSLFPAVDCWECGASTTLSLVEQVGCGINIAGCLLFYPSQESVMNAQKALNGLGQEFPINIYESMYHQLQISSTTASSTLEFNLYAGAFAGNASGTVKAWTSNDIPKMIGQDNWNSFYSFMQVCIYFLTVVYFAQWIIRKEEY